MIKTILVTAVAGTAAVAALVLQGPDSGNADTAELVKKEQSQSQGQGQGQADCDYTAPTSSTTRHSDALR